MKTTTMKTIKYAVDFRSHRAGDVAEEEDGTASLLILRGFAEPFPAETAQEDEPSDEAEEESAKPATEGESEQGEADTSGGQSGEEGH